MKTMLFLLAFLFSAPIDRIGVDQLKTKANQELRILDRFFTRHPKQDLFIRLENIILYPSDVLFSRGYEAYKATLLRHLNANQKQKLMLLRSYHLRDHRFVAFLQKHKQEKRGKITLFSIPCAQIIDKELYLKEMKGYLDYYELPYDDLILYTNEMVTPSKADLYMMDDSAERLGDKLGILITPEPVIVEYVMHKKYLKYQQQMFIKEGIWVTDHEVLNFFDRNTKEN